MSCAMPHSHLDVTVQSASSYSCSQLRGTRLIAATAMQMQSSAFNDCFVMGVLGQVMFGQTLAYNETLLVSPVLLAGLSQSYSSMQRLR
jgi:hypothetical protein